MVLEDNIVFQRRWNGRRFTVQLLRAARAALAIAV